MRFVRERAVLRPSALLLPGAAAQERRGAAAGSTAAEAVARAAEKTEGVSSLRYRMTGKMPEGGR